jgi:hypothetical protein
VGAGIGQSKYDSGLERGNTRAANPKSEIRNKFKLQRNRDAQNSLAFRILNIAAFGFPICFGFWFSGFGFGGQELLLALFERPQNES